MEVVHGLGDLVDNIAFMLFAEDVLTNEGVEVDVHELEEQIDILFVMSLDDFLQANNIGMV